jgi:hypothetical protein
VKTGLAFVLTFVLLIGPNAGATNASCPAPDSTWSGTDPWCYSWQGDWQQTTVNVPSHSGGTALAGTIFAPATLSGRIPAVAILHGLGGKEYSVWYLARYLAGHGYVALTVTTSGNQAANFTDAMQSMIDYLASGSNPYAAHIDTSRIGASGHSAGARAASWIQSADTRVRAVVALDNLTGDLGGDSGTYLLAPQCTTGIYPTARGDIVPRAPAMGLASDDNAVTCPERNVVADPDAKKAAWSKWRAAHLPTMELVLKDANHFSFDQDISRTITGESYLHLISYATQAWFDRYLAGKSSAMRRLLGPNLLDAPRGPQLSTQFHSAAYVPDRAVDCPDFETGC